MDIVPRVRSKNAFAAAPENGTAGFPAVLPEMQAGEPDKREKLQGGEDLLVSQTHRRSADRDGDRMCFRKMPERSRAAFFVEREMEK